MDENRINCFINTGGIIFFDSLTGTFFMNKNIIPIIEAKEVKARMFTTETKGCC